MLDFENIILSTPLTRKSLSTQFALIPPSLHCISDFLTISKEDANVKGVNGKSEFQKDKVMGYIGFGTLADGFSKKHDVPLWDLKKNVDENGEIAAYLGYILHFPVNNSDHYHSAYFKKTPFAHFYLLSKVTTLHGGEMRVERHTKWFAFLFRENKSYLITEAKCYDVTSEFVKSIWYKDSKGRRCANFEKALKDKRHIDDSFFAVVPDSKLKIDDELKNLSEEYDQKYGKGSFETDKLFSEDDWQNLSTLNETIAEAESFELEIEGAPKVKEPKGCDEVDFKEREVLCRKVMDVEEKLAAHCALFEHAEVPPAALLNRKFIEFNRRFTDDSLEGSTSNPEDDGHELENASENRADEIEEKETDENPEKVGYDISKKRVSVKSKSNVLGSSNTLDTSVDVSPLDSVGASKKKTKRQYASRGASASSTPESSATRPKRRSIKSKRSV